MPPVSELDPVKDQSNDEKHGIDFYEAADVFNDPKRIDRDSTRPEHSEPRWTVTGLVGDRFVTVVYTMRDHRIRIISARKARTNERRTYDSRDI